MAPAAPGDPELPATIPMTILAGYLGSGKTTRINDLLAAPPRLVESGESRIAVLVNGFGAVNVDADLLRRASGDVLQLENGCICCSVTDAMPTLLRQLREMAPAHVVLELSGVGLPGTARSWAGYPGFRLHTVVVCVDVTTIRQRLADRWVGDVALDQLRGADELLLTRTDLVDAAEVAAVVDLLAEVAPGIPVAERPLAEVLGRISLDEGEDSLGEVRRRAAPEPRTGDSGGSRLVAGAPHASPSEGSGGGQLSLGEGVGGGDISLGEVRRRAAPEPRTESPGEGGSRLVAGAPHTSPSDGEGHADHVTATVTLPAGVRSQAVRDWLERRPEHVVRAKGVVDTDAGARLVQLAGDRITFSATTDTEDAVASSLVVIATPGVDPGDWQAWLAVAPVTE